MYIQSTVGKVFHAPIRVDMCYSMLDKYAFTTVFFVNPADEEETVTWTCSIESLTDAFRDGSGGFGDMVFEVDEEDSLFVFHMKSHEGEAAVSIPLEAAIEFHSKVVGDTEESDELSFSDDELMEWLAQ